MPLNQDCYSLAPLAITICRGVDVNEGSQEGKRGKSAVSPVTAVPGTACFMVSPALREIDNTRWKVCVISWLVIMTEGPLISSSCAPSFSPIVNFLHFSALFKAHRSGLLYKAFFVAQFCLIETTFLHVPKPVQQLKRNHNIDWIVFPKWMSPANSFVTPFSYTGLSECLLLSTYIWVLLMHAFWQWILTNILSNRLAFQNVSKSLNCRDPSFPKQDLVLVGVQRLGWCWHLRDFLLLFNKKGLQNRVPFFFFLSLLGFLQCMTRNTYGLQKSWKWIRWLLHLLACTSKSEMLTFSPNFLSLLLEEAPCLFVILN